MAYNTFQTFRGSALNHSWINRRAYGIKAENIQVQNYTF